jgi:chromosome segregation ATPase
MQSLNERLERRGASIQNLEDEIASLKESSTAQQIALQEKIGTLQREIEEVHSEHSSLLILNDVLRKTAAREGAERDAAKEELIDAQRRLSQALVEFERTEKELAHLSATDTIVAENRELKTQLNGARIEREQARLIGETLSRLHAKESFRAKEAEEKIAPLHEENEKLKRELLIFQREAENVSNQLEQMRGERERHRLAMQKLEEVQTDRNYLKERLEKAELELMRGGASPVNAEELAHLREKIASLSQIDALHRQLKSQFDEKNKVLHETRAQLFRADTQLQSLLIEKEQKELQHNPISEEIRRELSAMEEEIGRLEQENGELEDLVSTLTENPSESPPRRKKKVKTNPDQELLF